MFNKATSNQRKQKGATLAEAASSISIFVPIIIIFIYMSLQCSIAYSIHTSLTQAALQAAHDLGCVWAARGEEGVALSAADQKRVYDKITVPYVIVVSEVGGMNPNFANAQFDFTSTPPAVTVTAQFAPRQGTVPSPLDMISTPFLFFNSTGIKLKASCTYPLPTRTGA